MRMMPWSVGACATLFYLAVHSTFYNFDGVACAIAVDMGDLPHLVHGNHIAYGLLGLAFHRLWQALGYAGPALLPLQALDSILGGAAAGAFCGLLKDLKIPPLRAVTAAAGLALSYAWWFWSLEPQVYMLGALFLVLAAREALSERPRPAVMGLCHAGAVLGHVGHMAWLPCALYLLGTSYDGRKKKTAIIQYGAVLAAALLASYAAVAIFIIRPSGQTWRLWLLGSAALSMDKSFSWHGTYSLNNLASWALMTLRVFVNPYDLSGTARMLGWALAALPLAAAGLGLGASRRLAAACLLWIAGYAMLYISWEPFTVVYRISDLIPLWILIALAAARVRGHWAAAALCAWVAAAGIFNWQYTIRPHADPKNNVAYQEALWLSELTPENSWISAVSIDQVYIPYFARRRPLNLRYFVNRREALARMLADNARAGVPVYVTSPALATDGWREFFAAYRLAESGRRGAFVLYRVGGRSRTFR